jgi:hypothetical protein
VWAGQVAVGEERGPGIGRHHGVDCERHDGRRLCGFAGILRLDHSKTGYMNRLVTLCMVIWSMGTPEISVAVAQLVCQNSFVLRPDHARLLLEKIECL